MPGKVKIHHDEGDGTRIIQGYGGMHQIYLKGKFIRGGVTSLDSAKSILNQAKGKRVMNEKYITEAKRIIAKVRNLDESDENGHRKLSYDEFVGVGHHKWDVNYNHGRWRNKHVTVQTKEKSEDAVRNHRFFKSKKGAKINTISYKGIREK